MPGKLNKGNNNGFINILMSIIAHSVLIRVKFL